MERYCDDNNQYFNINININNDINNSIIMAHTHISKLAGKIRRLSAPPSDPETWEMYYDTNHNALKIYDGTDWYGYTFATSTSTSSSTTSSTSTSTTTTTSTSTSTSTTTTSTSTSTTV